MNEKKYFGNMKELEKLLLTSPFWRKSGEGKFTAAEYHLTVRLMPEWNAVRIECSLFPTDFQVTVDLSEVYLQENEIFFGGNAKTIVRAEGLNG